MPVTILLFRNYSHEIGDLLFSRLCRHNRRRPTNCTLTKKQLYISLVRFQLMYCSQIWRPNLVQDIKLLERVQRRATKYILIDYTSSYKTRLLKLSMLPLMFTYELNDLLFLLNPSRTHLYTLTSPSGSILTATVLQDHQPIPS